MEGTNLNQPYYNPMFGTQQPYYGSGATGQMPYTGGSTGPMPSYTGFPPTGPTSPGLQPQAPSLNGTTPTPSLPGMLPIEASYIENILRLNKGKLATVYTTFENNREWNAKIFKGIIEAAGRDHLILSDPQTGMRYLILMVYLDYITFDEEIEYEYPFGGGTGLAVYPPR